VASDATLTLSALGAFQDTQQYFGNVPPIRVQVVAGLFKFAPEEGFDFSRRQLVLVYSLSGLFSNGRVLSLIPADDLMTVALQNATSLEPTGGRFAVAAGNFRGYLPDSEPLWSLLIGAWHDDGTYGLKAFMFDASGTVQPVGQQSLGSPQSPDSAKARLPVVAYDADGDTLYLGAPVHFTLTDLVRTDFIVQEPPKHLAYINGRVRNISRRPDFYVELKDSEGATFSTKSTDTSDWNFGGSLELSSKSTIKGSGDIGLVKVEAEASVAASAKVSYDYDEHQSSYNSSYVERTLTFTGQTNDDDYLVSQIQLFDIWRYRLYGLNASTATGKPINTFYDIVLPGPALEARGGGRVFDWYQPVHENGNILSYPRLTDKTSRPRDLGCFTLTFTSEDCTSDNGVIAPLVPPQLLHYDGTSVDIGLKFTRESGAGATRQYTQTLGGSLDLRVSAKAGASYFGVGGEVETAVNASINASNSWGNLSSSQNTTSESTGITLRKPDNGDITKAYPFAPLVYIARDGTFKVTHAVGELNFDDSWWQDTYGRKPDPALNLPNRFIKSGGTWEPNKRLSRKQLRGFFYCLPSSNQSAPCTPLTSQPVDGDRVRLLVQVYNYSTAKLAQKVWVRFEAVQYNTNTNREIGHRMRLGETTLAQILPRQMRAASLNWDTTGFGPASGRGRVTYRIYVVLDPKNTIKEIYETEPAGGFDPGQNNEGWGPTLTVAAPATARMVQQTPGSRRAAATGDLDSATVQVEAVAALDALSGELSEGLVYARRGEPLQVRVHLRSTDSDLSAYHLLVFAAGELLPRDRQGEVIAGLTVPGVDAIEGAYVWLEWIPTTLGDTELRAVLAEAFNTRRPLQDQPTLTVRVIE
jgi:hypothetical protein